MPVQLRKRPTCHYCGKRSGVSQSHERRFKCEHCLAVNFLDEFGEIADVPPEETETPKRYARPVAPSQVEQSLIFCPTCLKNQHLYTSALSEFLPDPTDPQYALCEAALPEFKKHLEERYPQCCAQCEPKVRNQLLQATYNARSDHMRRLLERSRARRIAHRWGWRRLVITGAGLGCCASFAVQVGWHAFSLPERGFSQNFRPSECWRKQPPEQCSRMFEDRMGLAIAVAVLCIWWNPKWQDKLQSSEIRLLGLKRYYRIQFALLAIRLTSWVLLTDLPMSQRPRTMLHSISLVMITVLWLWGLVGTVRIDTTPLVDWQQEQADLISPNQFVPPPQPQEPQSYVFPVGSLAAPNKSLPATWQPPTPPTENEDAMDWTPSQSFQPQPKQPRFKPTGPSPFHGTLPTVVRREGIGPRLGTSQKSPIGIPPGHFDHRKPLMPQQVHTQPVMAEPKFFLNNDKADTGLEEMFDGIFSLQDRSLRASTSAQQPNGTTPSPIPSHTKLQTPAAMIWTNVGLLIVAKISWFLSDFQASDMPGVKFWLIALVSAIPIGHIIMSGLDRHDMASNVIFGLESAILWVLTLRTWNNQYVDLISDKAGSGLIWLLLLHEIYLLSNLFEPPATPYTNNKLDISETFPSISKPTSIAVDSTRASTPPAAATPHSNPSIYRKDSSDSNASTSNESIITTSTASAWKTPRHEPSRFEFSSSTTAPRGRTSNNNSIFGMGTLDLNDGTPRSTTRTTTAFQAGATPRRAFGRR